MPPNREEKLVIDCLTVQGFTNIEYEPDGNIPPDILVNDRIAIEVRRLNQNLVIRNGFKGLEQDEFAIYALFQKIMDEDSDSEFTRSAFVCYSYERPLPEKKEIKSEVKRFLIEHKPYIDQRREYEISENFKVRIVPSENKLEKQYQYGLSNDGDSGGVIVDLIYKNLELIIKEKETKVSGFKHKYPEWWLAVVDTIGNGMDDLDLRQFNDRPKIKYDFERILLVSPLDPKKFLYLYE